jgi:hypothetical protein
MAIQIRGDQIQNNTVGPTQIDETATYDFSSGVVSVATPSANAHAATKLYVDNAVSELTYTAGDGIDINTATSPDTISVDIKADSGLAFDTGELKVALKAESGGSISVDANGLYIADAAIANGKLANSTISGVALGSNLNSLSAGQGISMTSFNGSAAVSDLTVNLDGGTLSKSASGLKIADSGVDTTQLADGAVETAKVGANAITSAKVSLTTEWHTMSPNGVLTSFDLGHTLEGAWAYIMVFRNGLAVEQVASSPSGQDQFTVSLNGGTGGVGQITFGSAPNSSDNLRAFYIADSAS